MHINIYAEDITHDWELEERTSRHGDRYIGVTFTLSRAYQPPSAALRNPAPARITFWCAPQKVRIKQMHAADLSDIFNAVAKQLRGTKPKPAK